MKYLINRLTGTKQWILSFVMVRIFLLSSETRQNYLITKNASLFLGLQNVAKHWDNLGDTVSAMEISGESYKYLRNFVLYCDALNIDQVKRLKLYAP
jgi:hypothetical protein